MLATTSNVERVVLVAVLSRDHRQPMNAADGQSLNSDFWLPE